MTGPARHGGAELQGRGVAGVRIWWRVRFVGSVHAWGGRGARARAWLGSGHGTTQRATAARYGEAAAELG